MTSWCMPYGMLAWLKALDDALARKFFDKPDSYVIGGAFPGYACTPVKLYTSFDTYAQTWPPGQTWVCYDPEHWANTPVIEQQHPRAFLSAFASAAHARGQKLITCPSRDLVWAPGADCMISTGEAIDAAYLRCGIPGAAAGADVLLVQAQNDEPDPVAYAALVNGAKAQQPAGQQLWAGLTTTKATAAQMLAAYRSASCDGYWVTIGSQAQAPVAVQFFQALAAGT